MPDHVSAASEIEEGSETNAEQVTKESSNKAKDHLSQTTVESRIQETPVEVAMEEQEIKQEYTIGENMEVTSETENDNENNVSEPSNFETSHEVTEIDILEPANTIENLIKEPSPHNQESKSEVGNTSMPPNKQEPKLKKKTLPCQKKHPQNLPFLKKVATSYTTHPPMVDSLFDLCFQSRVFLPCLHSPHQ